MVDVVTLPSAVEVVLRQAVAMDWQEGQDGTAVTYRERLVPSWWAWLVMVAMVAMFAVAYGAAIDATVGWIIGGAGVLLLGAALVATAPIIQVDDRVVRAGRARLPLMWVGAAEALDATAAGLARTTQSDPRNYLVLRTWASPRAVRMTVTDPQDPHPVWLMSSRHPHRLAEAISAATRRTDD
jgi:hypothetical protein